MRLMGLFIAICAGCLCGLARSETGSAPLAQVHALEITLLSTPVSGPAIGEWGFSALVEADGHRILFDTGQHPEVVLKNARQLKIDLTTVPEVILSHNHWDHVGGLMAPARPGGDGQNSRRQLARVHVSGGNSYPADDI